MTNQTQNKCDFIRKIVSIIYPISFETIQDVAPNDTQLIVLAGILATYGHSDEQIKNIINELKRYTEILENTPEFDLKYIRNVMEEIQKVIQ